MIGRDLSSLFPKTVDNPGAEVLRVEHLTREGVFTDVSLSVRAGEIVALSGLMGAGRSEVARAIQLGSLARSGKSRTRSAPASGTSRMRVRIELLMVSILSVPPG